MVVFVGCFCSRRFMGQVALLVTHLKLQSSIPGGLTPSTNAHRTFVFSSARSRTRALICSNALLAAFCAPPHTGRVTRYYKPYIIRCSHSTRSTQWGVECADRRLTVLVLASVYWTRKPSHSPGAAPSPLAEQINVDSGGRCVTAKCSSQSWAAKPRVMTG